MSGAQGVYTDVWTSMGFETEGDDARSRVPAISGERGADGAGCSGRFISALLPAHRGYEVTERVSSNSAAIPSCYDQAENRMYVQKGDPVTMLLLHLKGLNPKPQESSAGLFRRTGYLHHYSLAQGKLPAAK